jgi:hypothetical protein
MQGLVSMGAVLMPATGSILMNWNEIKRNKCVSLGKHGVIMKKCRFLRLREAVTEERKTVNVFACESEIEECSGCSRAMEKVY